MRRLYTLIAVMLLATLALLMASVASAQTAAVQVAAFLDANENGQQDAGEPNVPGGEVTLYDASNAVAAKVAVEGTGTTLHGIAPGTYRVVLAPAEGYELTGSSEMLVGLAGGATLELSFGVSGGKAATGAQDGPSGFVRVSGILVAMVALVLPLGVRLLKRP